MFDIDFAEKGNLLLHIRKFLLYPKYWKEKENSIDIILNWRHVKFTPANVSSIPEKCGLYCFVVQPEIQNFFGTSYLFYIGETQRTLKIRYGEYLSDQEGKGKPRPKVYEMLNLYNEHLHFYFAEINDKSVVAENEEKLLNTFVPAINTTIPNAKIKPELKNIYEH